MPVNNADTLRILIATDSHVGYCERDNIRGEDSWRTFDEVMRLAKEHDVDMVLLSGDLFHDNKPSQQAMYQVAKSLRENCLGDRPIELEMLSDTSEVFQMAGGTVNYENANYNVSIPVFTIHGNHDDPSGRERMSSLDLLSITGLINYFGRAPESDNITITPVLLQKGRTKLALYGLSNVRDERLFRTFRDGKVKWLRPGVQQNEWFNLMCVHQNHHGHTETGFLPENFLQDFINLVIWGHEHECLIDPRLNPETNFHVIQPGSSIATSLCPGEAVPKHVGILAITGKSFKLEKKIRLKTVRPFIMKEIVLADQPEMKDVWRKPANRTQVTKLLITLIEELIEEARDDWRATQTQDLDEDAEEPTNLEPPLPLIRLRVECSAPEGRFETENPRRFSNRFVGRVANVDDVVQFHRKKVRQKIGDGTKSLEDVLKDHTGSVDDVKIEDLVKEFLPNMTLFPSNALGNAVREYAEKDDKHAVDMLVEDVLKRCIKKLTSNDDVTEETFESFLEKQVKEGYAKTARTRQRLKEKPDDWDSDMFGHWADEPSAQLYPSEDEASTHAESPDLDRLGTPPPPPPKRTTKATRGRRGGAAAGRKPAARAAKKVVEEEDDEVMEDVEEEMSPPPPPTRTTRTRVNAKPTPKPAPASKTTRAPAKRSAPAPKAKQTKLQFGPQSQSQTQAQTQTQTQRTSARTRGKQKVVVLSSDDDDEEDDFE
ncbi:meiotic recombination [Rhizina undulata]